MGARDVVLGASTLAALGSGKDTTQMLRLGFAADVADDARSTIVRQVTNGVAVRMAVLYALSNPEAQPG